MMPIKCRNCPDIKFKYCNSPGIITNGILICETIKEDRNFAVCSQCGEPLVIGHFAYEPRWKEFWCEDCLRNLLSQTE